MPRRDVDDQVPNTSSIDGFKMLTNQMEMPAIDVCSGVDLSPSQFYKVDQGSLAQLLLDFNQTDGLRQSWQIFQLPGLPYIQLPRRLGHLALLVWP